jgi:hypothetical protein
MDRDANHTLAIQLRSDLVLTAKMYTFWLGNAIFKGDSRRHLRFQLEAYQMIAALLVKGQTMQQPKQIIFDEIVSTNMPIRLL